MDSEDDILFEDSEHEMEEEDDDDEFVGMEMEPEAGSTQENRHDEEEFPFQVLTTEEIVQHMVDCIKEVNAVVEVSIIDN